MKWYLEAFGKYAVFSGRARRKEFWYFVLFNLLFGFAAAFIDAVFNLYVVTTTAKVSIISTLYYTMVFIPSFAVMARRLHDLGRSGWWILFGLIPLIGLILWVYLLFDSQPGDNKYGPNPKE